MSCRACVSACPWSGCLVELARKSPCLPFAFSLWGRRAFPFPFWGRRAFPFPFPLSVIRYPCSSYRSCIFAACIAHASWFCAGKQSKQYSAMVGVSNLEGEPCLSVFRRCIFCLHKARNAQSTDRRTYKQCDMLEILTVHRGPLCTSTRFEEGFC